MYQHLGGGEWILRDLGTTMRKVHDDPKRIVECQLRAKAVYGHDNLIAGWGAYVEAHALGSVWEWGKDYYYPRIRKYRLAEPEDIASIRVPDPMEDPMMRVYVDALGMMVEEYGSAVPILGFLNSPLIAAEELRGCEALFMDMAFNAPIYQKTIDLMTGMCRSYLSAMLKAGVDGVLIEDGSLGGDQLSRAQAKDKNLASSALLVEDIRSAGKWAIVHNCSAEPYLDMHASIHPNAIDFWVKAKVDPSRTRSDLEGVCISTGADGMTEMMMAKPSVIERSVLTAYHEYGEQGGFVISTGGEIPSTAPVENIWALRRAAEKCGKA